MTILIQRMREELVRRNYATTTIHSYIKAVEHFERHVDIPLDQIGPDDIRSYHAYLLKERKLAVNTVVLNVCALRFLYIKVLKRRDMKEDLPYPKQRMHLPVILSPAEVAQLIGGARNLYHRTIIMMLYSTGLRRAELCRLKVSDIDSKRMMVRVEQGKGGIDREVPLSQTLLRALREYYRWMKPADVPVPGDGKRLACRQAGYGKDGLAGRPRGLHPRRYYQARDAAYSQTLLRNSSAGIRRRPAKHSDDARPLGYGSDHGLSAPVPPSPAGCRQSTRKDQRSIRQAGSAIEETAEAAMSRPAVEVADIVRAHGARFIEQNRVVELPATDCTASHRAAAVQQTSAATSISARDVVIRPCPITPAETDIVQSARRKLANAGSPHGSTNCSPSPTSTLYSPCRMS